MANNIDIVKIYKSKVIPGIDASVDLGQQNARWKGLFLSEGMLIGGAIFTSDSISMRDEYVLSFDGGQVKIGSEDYPLILRDMDGEHLISDIPAEYQMTWTVIQDGTHNIHGESLANYTAVPGGTAPNNYITIKYNGQNLDEDQARTYMEHMTGSVFVPVLNTTRPQNDIFLMEDLTLWRPQFNSIQGLVLYKLPSDIQVKLVSGENIKTIKGISILGSGDINTDPAAISNSEIDALFTNILNN